jgi:type IX secretion system PorP/SprF family membrane protein
MVDKKYPSLPYTRVLLTGVLMLFIRTAVTAQDPQFSQFYAAPLYLNPAFTGSTNQTRVGINYRNQWPAIDANFTTMSVYADHFMEDINSGVGLILNRDVEGLAGLQSISVGAQYAYELFLTKNLGFRPGVQVAVYILTNLRLARNMMTIPGSSRCLRAKRLAPMAAKRSWIFRWADYSSQR